MKNKIRISVLLLLLIGSLCAGCDAVGTVETIVTGNRDEYTGNILYDQGEKLVFVASHHEGNVHMEGGSWSTTRYIAIADGQIHVFYVSATTTADNGAASKRESRISQKNLKQMRTFAQKEKWKDIFELTDEVMGNAQSVLVSEGMNDSESRNIDGSYHWMDEFHSYYMVEEYESSFYRYESVCEVEQDDWIQSQDELHLDAAFSTSRIVDHELESIYYVQIRSDKPANYASEGVIRIYKEYPDSDTVTRMEYQIRGSNHNIVLEIQQCYAKDDKRALYGVIDGAFDYYYRDEDRRDAFTKTVERSRDSFEEELKALFAGEPFVPEEE